MLAAYYVGNICGHPQVGYIHLGISLEYERRYALGVVPDHIVKAREKVAASK